MSATEYSQAAPVNFGAQRIEQINKASGIDTSVRSNAIDAARRRRHALLPLDPSNWRRLFVRNGRVLSALPELDADHPLQRPEHAASLFAMLKSLPFVPRRVSSKLNTDQELEVGEQTVLRSRLNTDQELEVGEQTVLRSRPSTDRELEVGEQTVLRSSLESEKSVHRQTFSIGPLVPESAKIYAFLDIKQNEQVVQRIAIRENYAIVGRVDPNRGITPEIDLTQFDPSGTVSRQHARIHLEKTLFFIEDLKSRNKTRLGELTLTPLKPELLQDGDVVSFGSVKATFRLLGTSELPVPWSQS